jgi:hypothetical protein
VPPTRPSPRLPAKIYVPRENWLEVLAGDDPTLRDPTGKPMITVIGAAAGLSKTALVQIQLKNNGVGHKTMGALTDFLKATGRFTEAEALEALFERVEAVAA